MAGSQPRALSEQIPQGESQLEQYHLSPGLESCSYLQPFLCMPEHRALTQSSDPSN